MNRSIFKKKKIILKTIICLLISLLLIQPAFASSFEITKKYNYTPRTTLNNENPLDIDFILDVTEQLSSLIKTYPRGRDYGSIGEHKAAEILEQLWKGEISDNVTFERIDKEQPNDAIDFKLNITEYNLRINKIDIPASECFPIPGYLPSYYDNDMEFNYQFPNIRAIPDWIYKLANLDNTAKIHNMFILKNSLFKKIISRIKLPKLKAGIGPAVYLLDMSRIIKFLEFENVSYRIDEEYAKSVINNLVDYSYKNPFLPPAIGFICCEAEYDVHFMTFSTFLKKGIEEPGIITGYPIPGFTVSGQLGEMIKKTPDGRTYLADADFYIKSEPIHDAESYNVIGTIPGKNYGTSLDKTIIIGAHYDSWWGACVIDNAIGVGLVWGLAKFYSEYYKDKKPDHTLKFIAFGGEEYGLRGSKSYVYNNIYTGNEKVKFMINIDTVCYNDAFTEDEKNETCLNIWHYPYNSQLTSNLEDIVDNSKYKQMSGGFCIKNWGEINNGVSMSDSGAFKDFPEVAVIAFDKGDKHKAKGFYHRTGQSHTKGDVWDLLDLDDIAATSKVILDTVNLTLNYR